MKDRSDRSLLAAALRYCFPAADARSRARAMLSRYGTASHEREIARVRLAILRLSGPDPDVLERTIDEAKLDYRDVLAWAEFPTTMRLGPGASASKAARARAADRAAWLAWIAEICR